MKKAAFTMIEMIFVIVILGILAAIAIPRYLAISQASHEAVLISFAKSLNRTTGQDLWARSISEGKNGSIKNLSTSEGYEFLSKYIKIPPEIDKESINLKNCGDNSYQTVIVADAEKSGGEYNITCKDGNETSAPYFQLIRLSDNKVLVSREN
jgi:prepilin-type N-terminal cleavage/methylation domain-containing protein